MNLRLLVNPKEAEGHPIELFFVGAVYAFLGVMLSLLLFPEQASMVMITITVAAATPIVFHIITFETMKQHVRYVSEHRRAMVVFTLLFLGFVVGYLAGFFILPAGFREQVFSAQAQAITSLTGGFINFAPISQILFNNLRVLFFTVLLSLFFGAGGIFILAWNASVLALALGSFILNKMAMGSPMIVAVGASLAKYMIHGIPEMAAYFVGALAGGIVFNAVVRKLWSKRVFLEVLLLLLFASLILVGAAGLEVYFKPLVR